jgi:undecaprenyl-diphosphatase
MSTSQAIVLGIVEGLTEYLPISSTGHLYLTERIMGIGYGKNEKQAADAYAICIQAGAILAVLGLYFKRVKSVLTGIFVKNSQGRKLGLNLIAAFIPAAVIGIIFEKIIKLFLFGLWPITLAWLIGGIAILIVAKNVHGNKTGKDLEDLTVGQSFIIGFIQCIAMWPGTSRSLVTILGGVVVGLSVSAAVEFSFLLGVVTLGAATLYEAVKSGNQIVAMYGVVNPLIGFVAAFISAVFAVKWMVGYLNKHSLAIFGYYRIVIALVVGILLISGMILK